MNRVSIIDHLLRAGKRSAQLETQLLAGGRAASSLHVHSEILKATLKSIWN